jgi:hypothetical protein
MEKEEKPKIQEADGNLTRPKLQATKVEEKPPKHALLGSNLKNSGQNEKAGVSRKRKAETEEVEDDSRFTEAYTCGSGANPEMPATWHAWYETMPHLNAKHAYKRQCRTQEREDKMKKVEEFQKGDVNKDLLDMDMEALEAEMQRVQKDSLEQKAICEGFEEKISKVEEADRREEQEGKVVSKKLLNAGYKHGIMEGKIRSSETYFKFVHEETASTYKQKRATMMRSVNLMQGEIANLKTEVRDLLRQAREQKERDAKLSERKQGVDVLSQTSKDATK